MSLFSLFALASLLLAALGLGQPIWRGLGLGDGDRLSGLVWSLALGLITAGMLLVGLGLVGLLYVPLIVTLTVAAAVWGMADLLLVSRRAPWEYSLDAEDQSSGFSAEEPTPWPPPARWLYAGLLAAAGVASAGSLIGAMAPPVAGDALCYHLELPKTFLLEHRLAYLPYHDNSTFPLLAEMWYLWGLALEGGVCAQLVHWALGCLLALATVVLATPILGRSWSWLAAAIVLLTPGVNNQMTAPLNDVALAAFTTLALAAWWRAVINDEGRRWFLLAGLMAGAALGTKYLALVFAAALAATWLWIAVRHPARRTYLVQGAGVMLVTAASIAGVWYVRAAWHRGNPVYPFLNEVFASQDAADPLVQQEDCAKDRLPVSPGKDRAEESPPAPAAHVAADDSMSHQPGLRPTLPASKSPLGRSPWGLAVAPWQITMHPERFGGRGHQLGVLLPVALPGLVLCRRLRGLGSLLAVAGTYFIFWYLLRQNVRFLFPVAPLLAVAAVWVAMELRRMPRLSRHLALAVVAAVIAAMAVLPLRRARDAAAVATGLEDRESYLLRHEPTYPAACVANHLLGPDAHLLTQDYRTFYFQHRATRENVYRRASNYDRRLAAPGAFSDQIRAEGFTHVLLAQAAAGQGISYDPVLARLVDDQLAGPEAEKLLLLTEYQFHDRDGNVRHYRLLMLR